MLLKDTPALHHEENKTLILDYFSGSLISLVPVNLLQVDNFIAFENYNMQGVELYKSEGKHQHTK
jgi:hypothetical protein